MSKKQEEEMPQVTVGRVVHVQQAGSPEHLACVVAFVHPDGTTINCAPLAPTGTWMQGLRGVLFDDTGGQRGAGWWHWPERAG